MKRIAAIAAALALVAPAAATAQETKPQPLPKGFEKRSDLWGYAIGRLLGRGLKNRFQSYSTVDWKLLEEGFELGVYGREVDAGKAKTVGYLLGHWIGLENRRKLAAYLPFVGAPSLARGFVAGARGTSAISFEQGEEAIFELQEAMVKTLPPAQRKGQLERVKVARKRARARRAKLAERERAGTAFREGYTKQHADAKTTASGLIYRVLETGAGRSPTRTEWVQIHYEVRDVKGQVLDSTFKRKPKWVGVTHGVPGWVEAVKMMKVGATWEIVVKPELAYDQSSAGRIEAGSTLVFKIKLLEISAKKPTK